MNNIYKNYNMLQIIGGEKLKIKLDFRINFY